MIKLKIIVAGAKDVGKTSLIRRYITGSFQTATLSTIGVDFMTKTVEMNGTKCRLTLWDFAGERSFRKLFPGYMTGANGALILYDITSRASFNDLTDWMELISGTAGNVTKILIGSKVDLAHARQVSPEDVQGFVDRYRIDQKMECSSKTGENVETLFTAITTAILATNLRECPHCKEMIPKTDVTFCNFCGKPV